jgi:hypothetical protein
LALVAAVGLAALTAGCQSYARKQEANVGIFYPHARGETMGETSEEHYHRVSRYSSMYSRGLVEDLDLLFMTDRGSRLTRWHER